MLTLDLLPLNLNKKISLTNLLAIFREALNINITVNHPIFDLGKFYNSERRQYNAADMLNIINPESGKKYILITEVDLFVPIFTYVFGLAHLGGATGVVSTHRLDASYYGLPADSKLLQERLAKEILHEFGHLVDLRHCNDYSCVMTGSESADDLDIKGFRYCQTCLVNVEIQTNCDNHKA